VDALARIDGTLQATLRRQGREREEGRAGADETGQEQRGGQGVRDRVGEGEGERNAGVEQKVRRDVEVAAAVGRRGDARQRAVEAVAQAACGHQREAGRDRKSVV